MSSVTSMLGHLDSSGFGVGMGWALKVARLADDLDAPRRASKEAQEQGTLLHDAIDSYINELHLSSSVTTLRYALAVQLMHWSGTRSSGIGKRKNEKATISTAHLSRIAYSSQRMQQPSMRWAASMLPARATSLTS